ncbi:MAG: BolA/IbaG family iron-sulfur metabolism protein [Leptospiraceae bacterium]|nr:BolA/IbaG family iron-sulfur metabolism protein [Leptospiraceae bacterium]
MDLESIRQRIEKTLPGAIVEVLDPRRDGVHLQARVTYAGFAGKTLLEQHRMVYDGLAEELKGGDLHALALETITA